MMEQPTKIGNKFSEIPYFNNVIFVSEKPAIATWILLKIYRSVNFLINCTIQK
jgi:hypothetical protein